MSFHQFIFDDDTTDSSSSEGDGPTTIPQTPEETIPETQETPPDMEKEVEAVDEEVSGEKLDDTPEQPEEQSPGQKRKRKKDERNFVDHSAEAVDEEGSGEHLNGCDTTEQP